jgi:hypothetical protein
MNASIDAGSGVGSATGYSATGNIVYFVTRSVDLPARPTVAQNMTAKNSVNVEWQTAAGPTSLTDDRGATVMYELEQCQGDASTCNALVGTWATPAGGGGNIVTNAYSVGGLDANSSYVFRVRTVLRIDGGTETNPVLTTPANYVENGDWYYSDTFATLSSALSAPVLGLPDQSLLAEAQVASGSISLNWTPSSVLGTSAETINIKYDIECSVAGTGVWTACSAIQGTRDLTSTSAVLSGLQPGQSYDFRIKAKATPFTWADQLSATQSVVLAKKINASNVLPSTIDTVTSIVTANWSVPTAYQNYLSWDGPAGSNNIVKYLVEAVDAATGAVVASQEVPAGPTGPTTATTTFVGLTDGLYNFRYSVYTAAGFGTVSGLGGQIRVGLLVTNTPPDAVKSVTIDYRNQFFELYENAAGNVEVPATGGTIRFQANVNQYSEPIDHFIVRWGKTSAGDFVGTPTEVSVPFDEFATDQRYSLPFTLTAEQQAELGETYKVEVISVGVNSIESAPVTPSSDPATGASFLIKQHFALSFDAACDGAHDDWCNATLLAQVPATIRYVKAGEPLTASQVLAISNQTQVIDNLNDHSAYFLGWEISSNNVWSFQGDSATLMPSRNVTLRALWYRHASVHDVANDCNPGAQLSTVCTDDELARHGIFDNEVDSLDHMVNGKLATQDDESVAVGRMIRVVHKNGEPVVLPNGVRKVDLEAGDKLSLEGRGFTPGETVLIGIGSVDSNGMVQNIAAPVTPIQTASIVPQAPGDDPIKDIYPACSANGRVMPCWVTANDEGKVAHTTAQIPPELETGSYLVLALVNTKPGVTPCADGDTNPSGCTNGIAAHNGAARFVEIPAVTARSEKTGTLTTQTKVQADIVSMGAGGGGTTPPPTTPGGPGQEGSGVNINMSFWVCMLNGEPTAKYENADDCASHGGKWTFVMNGTGGAGGNGGNGAGGGGTTTIIPGAGGSPVYVQPGGGSVLGAAGGTGGVSVSPVISNGAQNVTVNPPQIGANNAVFMPDEAVRQYCTNAEYNNAEDCAASGAIWVDRDATAKNAAVGLLWWWWIPLLAMFAIGLLLLLLFLLKKRRKSEDDANATGQYPPYFPPQYRR